MKTRISFKTPDVVDYAVEDCVDEEDKEFLTEFLSQWIKDGEYVSLEFDTEKGTAVVLPVK
jgi:hypothetical protein